VDTINYGVAMPTIQLLHLPKYLQIQECTRERAIERTPLTIQFGVVPNAVTKRNVRTLVKISGGKALGKQDALVASNVDMRERLLANLMKSIGSLCLAPLRVMLKDVKILPQRFNAPGASW
jgi:hypothetical protein